jgi:hypothetical protein
MPFSFVIDAAALLETLTRTARFVGKDNGNTIRTCVLLVAAADGVTLEAGDGRVDFVSAPVPANVHTPGRIAIAATALLAAVKAVGGGTLTMNYRQEAEGTAPKCQLTAPGVSYTLTGIAAGAFPAGPDASGPVFTFTAADLCRVFGAVTACIAPDDNRYGLNGVHLELRTSEGADGKARFVATDGNRLAWDECGVQGDATIPRKCILPRQAVAALSTLLAGMDGPVTVTPADKAIHFASNMGIVRARWTEADFPDYRQVLPGNPKGPFVTINREALIRAIDRAIPFAGGNDKSVKVQIGTDGLTMTTRMLDVGEGMIEVPAEVTGEPQVIGLNGRYLRETAGSMSGETVAFAFSGPLSPVYVVTAGDVFNVNAARLNVLMPLRLD